MVAQEGTKENTNIALYVGDLSHDVTERDLVEYFGGDKIISSAKVCRDSNTKRSLGYGYINFFNAIEAEAKMDTLNYTVLLGKPIRIMKAEKDAAKRLDRKGNLLIKNIDQAVDSRTVYESFKSFGALKSFKLATDDLGNSKGYGFLHYEKEEDADRVIKSINGLRFKNKQLIVCKVLPKEERVASVKAGKNNLYVKNFYPELGEIELIERFRQFGPILSTHFPRSAEDSGKCIGFGFVCFLNPGDANTAIEKLNGVKITERKSLYVTYSLKKKERLAQIYRAGMDRKMKRAIENKRSNLYLKGFGDEVTDADLLEYFKSFGAIKNARVMKNEKGLSKKFGFVCFENPDSVDKVLEVKEHQIKGKIVYIARHQTKDERRDQLSREYMRKKKSDHVIAHPMHSMNPQVSQFFDPMVNINPQYDRQIQHIPITGQFLHGQMIPQGSMHGKNAVQYTSHMRHNQAKNNNYGRHVNMSHKNRGGQGVRGNNHVQGSNPDLTQNRAAHSTMVPTGVPGNAMPEANRIVKPPSEYAERVFNMAQLLFPQISGKVAGVFLSSINGGESIKSDEQLREELEKIAFVLKNKRSG